MMPRKEICHVCLYDKTLRNLKTSVTEFQAELRFDWRACPIIQLDEHVLSQEPRSKNLEWFVLNDKGIATVIPSYANSNRAWEKALFINPLDVDWMRFEVHDTADADYLVSVVEILQDMQDLWIYDNDTRGHAILRVFSFFMRALKRLLMYAGAYSG
jgi:hypothetical protein